VHFSLFDKLVFFRVETSDGVVIGLI
jgi:hypothetical protein